MKAHLLHWFHRASQAARAETSTAALVSLAACLTIVLSACGGGGDSGAPELLPAPAQAAAVTTFRTLDMSVSGPGMFTMLNEATGEKVYSRYGRFDVDAKGRVVHADGGIALSFPDIGLLGDVFFSPTPASSNLIQGGGPAKPFPLVSLAMPDVATTRMMVSGILDAVSPISSQAAASWNKFPWYVPGASQAMTGLAIYDQAGQEIELTMYFSKQSINEWLVYYKASGVMLDTVSRLSFDDAGANIGEQIFTVDIPALKNMRYGAANSLPIKGLVISMAEVVQMGASSNFFSMYQNGSSAGKLSNITVATDGLVTLFYSNGISRPLGRVALAKFTDTDRLGHFGAHSWTCREQCVTPELGRGASNLDPFGGQIGEVLGGSLEGPI